MLMMEVADSKLLTNIEEYVINVVRPLFNVKDSVIPDEGAVVISGTLTDLSLNNEYLVSREVGKAIYHDMVVIQEGEDWRVVDSLLPKRSNSKYLTSQKLRELYQNNSISVWTLTNPLVQTRPTSDEFWTMLTRSIEQSNAIQGWKKLAGVINKDSKTSVYHYAVSLVNDGVLSYRKAILEQLKRHFPNYGDEIVLLQNVLGNISKLITVAYYSAFSNFEWTEDYENALKRIICRIAENEELFYSAIGERRIARGSIGTYYTKN
ncbi:hypothetical protein ABNZ43_02365 [Weissella sp. GP1]